jgi:hypothetical protein
MYCSAMHKIYTKSIEIICIGLDWVLWAWNNVTRDERNRFKMFDAKVIEVNRARRLRSQARGRVGGIMSIKRSSPQNEKGTAWSAAGQPPDSVLEQIRHAIKNIQYGEIRVIIQDHVIVQIERVEKQRLR